MKEEITYKSKDGITNIRAVIWVPKTEIKAIVQISHGMVEHIDRYQVFAASLNNKGILVCGNDHLGHGHSVIKASNLGYFADKDSENILVDDLHTLTTTIKERYPNIPYFLLGHSMGSFIARNYLTSYSEELTGAIIVGSGFKSSIIMDVALALTWLTQLYHHGWYYRSPLLFKLTTGSYHKRFEEGKDNPLCWLTSDVNIINEYRANPLTNFRFTCNGYKTLFTLIKRACQKKNATTINKNLPILVLAGKDDPVGNYGKDIYKIERLYKSVGIKSVSIKLYNGMRHEIINERNNVLPITDIINFMEKERIK
ncbi:MAG: lysophospholipase [Bacilli bacterium]|nr:lysophospholipase [Bacilli bacterium]